MKLKYIIAGFSPVIFNELLTHSDVAKGLGEIKSAGFVYVDWNPETEQFDCKPFGESESIGVKSNPESDKKKLDIMFNKIY
jgi:hypothetical protein